MPPRRRRSPSTSISATRPMPTNPRRRCTATTKPLTWGGAPPPDGVRTTSAMWPISAPSAPTSGSRTRRETYTRRSVIPPLCPSNPRTARRTRCRRSSVLLAVRAARDSVMTSLRILGPVEVWQGEQRLALGGPRQLALFAFLVLHPNRAVSRDALIDALWGPARTDADNRLQMAIARLRKALEPVNGDGGARLQTVKGGYLLAI